MLVLAFENSAAAAQVELHVPTGTVRKLSWSDVFADTEILPEAK